MSYEKGRIWKKWQKVIRVGVCLAMLVMLMPWTSLTVHADYYSTSLNHFYPVLNANGQIDSYYAEQTYDF